MTTSNRRCSFAFATTSAAALVALAAACSDPAAPPKSTLLAGDAGDAALAVDAAIEPDAAPPKPLCDRDASWDPPTPVQGPAGTLSGDDDELIGSMTSDELSVSWTVAKNAEAYYADRAKPGDPFGAPQKVAGLAVSPLDRVALSHDGRQLATIGAGGRSIVVFARAARGDAFALGDAKDFTAITAQASAAPASALLSDLVFSGDGLALYYSLYAAQAADGGGASTLFVSTRTATTDPWPTGKPRSEAELSQGGDGLRKRPTGISADGLTLFFLDEGAGMERAAHRVTAAAPFSSFVDLGPRLFATPSADCSRLYYSQLGPAPDAGIGSFGSIDLLVANKK